MGFLEPKGGLVRERTFNFEVRNIKMGTDKDERPYVEVVLRTQDFDADEIIRKYKMTIMPLKVKLIDYLEEDEVKKRLREIF